MPSPAHWVARSLEKHNGVDRASVVGGDCVEIQRRSGLRAVTVRVVDTRVEDKDLDQIGLEDVDAIVTLRRQDPYAWEAKVQATNRGHDLYSNRELWRAINSERFVRSESSDVEYFVERIGSHDKVTQLERLGPKLFRVWRSSGLDEVIVYCADEYILSEDSVRTILEECPETQVIANLSSWNSITQEADDEAQRRDCRVFDLSGMYRALNHATEAIRDL
jgi:hypothetical protein